MGLKDYFESAKGWGALATADKEGRVDVAIYGRPQFVGEENIAFIMADRLTHHNLQSNPHAAYLFMEEGPGYSGKRLLLTKVKEEKDAKLIEKLRRRKHTNEDATADSTRFLVYFQVDKVLPLIGAGN